MNKLILWSPESGQAISLFGRKSRVIAQMIRVHEIEYFEPEANFIMASFEHVFIVLKKISSGDSSIETTFSKHKIDIT